MGGNGRGDFCHVPTHWCAFPISLIRFIRLHFRFPNYLILILSGSDGGSIIHRAQDFYFLTRRVCWFRCCLCAVEQLKARRLKHDNVTGSLLRLLHSSLRVSQVTCPANNCTKYKPRALKTIHPLRRHIRPAFVGARFHSWKHGG
mgnify:CR=1 FL=1|jgi:hypothetical protein